MLILTSADLSKLIEKGDTLYYVNPYSSGDPMNVVVRTYHVVSGVDSDGKIEFMEVLKTGVLSLDSKYISDLNADKYIGFSRRDAMLYLELYQSNIEHQQRIRRHHDSFSHDYF